VARVLELQRLAGNDSVAALLGAEAQRAVAPDLIAQEMPPMGSDPVVEVASDIIDAAGPLAGTKGAHGLWDKIRYQFTNRQASSAKASKATGPLAEFTNFLYSAALATRINKLKKAQKQKALEHIFEALSGAADVKIEASGGTPSLASSTEEFMHLQATKLKDFVKSEEQYRGVRSGLLGAFGAIEVGTLSALKNAETYYGTMKPIASFIGKNLAWTCYVHPDMAKAIQKAEDKVNTMREEKAAQMNARAASWWYYGLQNSINNFGDGVEIRANANNALELSLHSYGWAIDVNASFNPNVPGFPRELVKEMTGVDVFAGSTGQTEGNFARGKTQEQDRKEAERLRQASAKFAAAFASEDGLKAAMLETINQRLGLTWDKEVIEALYPDVMAAVDAGKDKKKQSEREAARASARDNLAAHIRGIQEYMGSAPPLRAGEYQRLNLANRLIEMADIYKRSFITDKKGKQRRVTAEARVTDVATIAAHGFMNLDPDLVGALSGTDGGGLSWLGAVDEKNTKDFMHFELAQRPPLY
jgi:hypothetical protein